MAELKWRHFYRDVEREREQRNRETPSGEREVEMFTRLALRREVHEVIMDRA